MKTGSFPRISIGGSLILTVYSFVLIHLFNKSMYGKSLQSGSMHSSSSILLNASTMAASLLNVMSHALVVLGALNDTYVLSVLLGVGFDVITRILYLIWWIQLSRISTAFEMDHYSIKLIFLLSAAYIYHMLLHLRALKLNSSKERLRMVLTGALNNIRGIPGKGFHDHIFAYSDLGGHLLPMVLCTILLHKQESILVAFRMVLLMSLLSFVAILMIPSNEQKDRKGARSLIQISTNGSVFCKCDACTCKSRRTNQKVSFTFHYNDGICYLWLCSFETLSNILTSFDTTYAKVN